MKCGKAGKAQGITTEDVSLGDLLLFCFSLLILLLAMVYDDLLETNQGIIE